MAYRFGVYHRLSLIHEAYPAAASEANMDEVGPSKSQQADVLRNAVHEAYELVQKTHVEYEHAVAVAADTDVSSEGLLALRQQGRDYAQAVRQYSNAVMTWLSFMDTLRENSAKLVCKSRRG